MKKVDEKLAKVSEDLASLSEKAALAADEAKLQEAIVEDKIAEAKGNVAAMEENIRIAKEEKESKLTSALLKAKMDVKAKIEDGKAAIDAKMMERYIDSQIDYIFECYDAALYLITNARLAILETLEAAAEYDEKYGG